MVNELFAGSIRSIERSLDVRALRQDLIASNIANAETPGYRALDVDFEATMRDLLERDAAGGASHRGGGEAPSPSLRDALHIVGADAQSIGNAQVSVDMDDQMGRLEENSLMFQVTAQLAQSRFQGLKRVIEEGGRRS